MADHGLTLDPASGELIELAPFAARFSARAAQIDRNVQRLEAEWRNDHPDEEPGPRLRQVWDLQAWAQERPDKVVPTDGAAMVAAWGDELRRLGYDDPAGPAAFTSPQPGALDRDGAAEVVLSRLG